MEFLEGQTLADRLMKGPLPLDEVLKYGIEICEGLERAHKTGVTHRDLKPGNIMLMKSGAKLMDFGLAKATAATAPPASSLTMTLSGPSGDQPLTARGTIVGTFQYMSPEQVEGKEADARSDIFALGAVLYEMASGKRAFSGKTQASIVAAILASEPQPISAAQPMSPPALDRVVQTCLAKDPDERFQTVHDVKLQLHWLAEGGSQAGAVVPQVAGWRHRERWLAAVAVLSTLTALVFAVAYFLQPAHPAPLVRSSILPPENSAFVQGAGGYALSPDGSRLAFVAQSLDGKTSLWVRSLDSLAAQELVGTDNASLPFWSADGQWIGFFAYGKLRKTLASGGSVQEICDAPMGRGGTWNAQGTIVFAPNISGPLVRVSANGGVPVAVGKLDASRAETTHRWPDFLPDGEHFLYLGRNLSSEKTAALYVGSLDGSPARRIAEQSGGGRYAWPGFILYVRNTILLAQKFDAHSLALVGDPVPIASGVATTLYVLHASFDVSQTGEVVYQSVSEYGDVELEMMDRSGKTLSVIGTQGNYAYVRLSPDGQKVAVVDSTPGGSEQAIWLYDLKSNVKTRFSFGSGLSGNPVWSPDGSRIAFTSTRSGVANIYVKPTTGASEEKALFESSDDQRPKSWSPDGRYIAFEDRGSGFPAVWILPLFGDRKPYPLLNASYPTVLPQFSPDGHWIAYVSSESGTTEVYVTSFPEAKGKWLVSSAGGTSPNWRRDGRELFYAGANGALMAAEVSAKPGSFTVGAVRQLSERRVSQANALLNMYDVFPDGQRFIISAIKPEAVHTPLSLITNWPATLPK